MPLLVSIFSFVIYQDEVKERYGNEKETCNTVKNQGYNI